MCMCKDTSLLAAMEMPKPVKADNRRVYHRNKCCCCIHYMNFSLICYHPRGHMNHTWSKCNQYPFASPCTSASAERLIIDASISADNDGLNYFPSSFHPPPWNTDFGLTLNTATNNNTALGLASLDEWLGYSVREAACASDAWKTAPGFYHACSFVLLRAQENHHHRSASADHLSL